MRKNLGGSTHEKKFQKKLHFESESTISAERKKHSTNHPKLYVKKSIQENWNVIEKLPLKIDGFEIGEGAKYDIFAPFRSIAIDVKKPEDFSLTPANFSTFRSLSTKTKGLKKYVVLVDVRGLSPEELKQRSSNIAQFREKFGISVSLFLSKDTFYTKIHSFLEQEDCT